MGWKLMAWEKESSMAVIDNVDLEGAKTQIQVPDEFLKDKDSFLMYLAKAGKEVEIKMTEQKKQEEKPFDPIEVMDADLPEIG